MPQTLFSERDLKEEQTSFFAANDCAEASRFQRAGIALCTLLAVMLNEHRLLYPILISFGISLLTSTRFDPFVLFYRHVLVKILGKDPWPITEDATGKYLLGNAAEKFIFSMMVLVLLSALFLYAHGSQYWVIPAAIVAAGTSLSATTGICLMGLAFIQARRLVTHAR